MSLAGQTSYLTSRVSFPCPCDSPLGGCHCSLVWVRSLAWCAPCFYLHSTRHSVTLGSSLCVLSLSVLRPGKSQANQNKMVTLRNSLINPPCPPAKSPCSGLTTLCDDTISKSIFGLALSLKPFQTAYRPVVNPPLIQSVFM